MVHESENEKFKGVWPVMFTPYNDAGLIDLESYENLVDWYISEGVDGIFAVCGSSEMFQLKRHERTILARKTVEIANGRVPVIATGNFGDNVDEHVSCAKEMAGLGLDAVILTTPDFCNDEYEIKNYFLRMADNVNAELGIYEWPCGRWPLLSPDIVGEIATTRRYFVFKETSCTIETIKQKLAVSINSPMKILQANLALMLDAADAGVTGYMGIAANILPGDAVKAWRNRDADAMGRLCIVDAVLRLGYPLSGKFMLQCLGLPIGLAVRTGPTELSQETRRLIEQVLGYILQETQEYAGN